MARFRMLIVVLLTGAALAVPFGSVGHAAAPAAPARWNWRTQCIPNFYLRHYCSLARGTFFVFVPGATQYRITGRGTPASRRTAVFVTGVPSPWRPQQTRAFAVFTSGPIPPMRLNRSAPLFYYSHATARVTRVSAVTRAGIYVIQTR